MRILILSLFLTLATLALAGDTPPTSVPSAPGRYQLFSGNTWVAADNKGVEVPVVLKIDTQTGQTWMLTMVAGMPGTSNMVGFVPLIDSPAKKASPLVQ
jgi:hypothetical protein